jgi:hypothetical protein
MLKLLYTNTASTQYMYVPGLSCIYTHLYFPTPGVLRVTGGLDRETKDVYNITVLALDGRNEGRGTVYVHLTDANDNCPVFHAPVVMATVPENENATLLSTLSATDRDQGENGRVTFYADESGKYIYYRLLHSFSVSSILDYFI